MPEPDFHNFTRERGEYLLSTDKRWVNIETLRAVYASDLLHWTKPLPPKVLKKMVDNSLCFSLVHFPANGDWEQIGFARVITDYVTIGYLTDVYVIPEHQGKGLGKWMISCLPELLGDMEDLRAMIVLTYDKERFYREVIGAEKFGEDLTMMEWKGRGSVR